MNMIPNTERRRYLRYHPHSVHALDLEQKSIEAICHIDLGDEVDNFHPGILGMIIDKSHSGCSLVISRIASISDQLQEGLECVVKAGPLHPLKAVIRWRNELSDEVVKIGIEYLE